MSRFVRRFVAWPARLRFPVWLEWSAAVAGLLVVGVASGADRTDGGMLVAMRFQEADAAEEAEPEPASAAEAVEPVTVDSVTKRLEAVKGDESIDPLRKEPLVETLSGTLESLRQRVADAEEAARHKSALEDVSSRMAKARAEAEAASNPVEGPPAYLPITRVREGKSAADTEVAEARDQLQRVQKTIQERQSVKDSLPSQIQEARSRVADLESGAVPELADDPEGRLRRAREAKRLADLEAARQRLERLTQYQRLIEAETDLLPLQEKAAKTRLQKAEAEAKAWAEALSKRRESQLQGSLNRYRAELEREGIAPDRSLLLGRKDLQEYWFYIVGETSEYDQQQNREASRAKEYRDSLTDIREQIAEHREKGRALGGSLGLRLRLEKNSLPTVRQIQTEIAEVDAKIEMAEVKRSEATLVLESARRSSDEDFSGEMRFVLPRIDGGVHPTEERLLEEYLEDIRVYYSTLINLQATLDDKRDAVAQLRAEIDAHVLWVPNHPRFRLDDFRRAWVATERLFHPTELKRTGAALITGLLRRPDLLLLAVVSIGTLAFGGPRVRRKLAALGKEASPMQVVSLRPTWLALLLTVIQSFPLPLLLWVLGQAIRVGLEADRADMSIAPGLELAALLIWPIELLRQIIRPNGLLTAHFGVADRSVKSLRMGLRVLIDVGLPLVVIWSVGQRLVSMGVDATLGRLVFCLGMLLLSYEMWVALHPDKGVLCRRLELDPEGWLSRLRGVWLTLGIGFPLVLAGLTIAGYSFGAASLVECLYGTLWLGILTLLAFGFIKRWLLTHRRRLAVAARQKRAEAIEAGLIEEDQPQEATLDISEINAQTSRLLRTVFTVTALIGLAWVWAPVFPAIDYLDRVQLWPAGVDEDQNKRWVTLASLVKAMPVLFLTVVAVRNLPGLIEGMLLERLPLQKAARYAIVSLTTYALVMVGLIWAAWTLGFQWQNIQWLVAALGVGLGFGLQEIFANFVSGLILLFEQPIRVGDIVTIGDTTGTVSRIRIRATTVTNYDRQELVIPNKDLITGRLINWTLSDALNRIVVEVGVAYGSDTNLACQLLHEVCADHPNLTTDPAPIVTFEGFGDSTLNLVMRCYLPNLERRLATIHDLHTMIDQRFRDAGIEIAFPQRDLHVRSLPPELLRLPEAAEGGQGGAAS